MSKAKQIPTYGQDLKWQSALLVLLLVVALFSVVWGNVTIPVSEILAIMRHHLFDTPLPVTIMPSTDAIVWELRLPRLLLAAVVGSGLALSGTVMQATVQNPLAEPFILGIASGASVGAVIAIVLQSLLGMAFLGIAGWAFLGALGAAMGVLLLAGLGKRLSTVKLVLAGAVMSSLCLALTNFIIYMAADADGIQTATFWMMGSLADAKWENLWLPVLTVLLIGGYFLSQLRVLDALLLGGELALTLGIQTETKRRWYMILVAVITGVMVAQCGIISFVGLVIPHMMRSWVGASHRRLLPCVLLGGAIFLAAADLASRILLSTGDLPIGVITSLLGAPLFMKLLFGRQQNFGSR